MPDILLSTLNARYAHASLGLRYLLANLGELRPRAELLEFDINQRPVDMLEAILARSPRIVGLGVYIWNVEATTRLAADLKRVRPDITLVLGGPEVSHETQGQEIVRLADFVVTGEADLAFARLCGQLLRGERPLLKVIAAGEPEAADLALPYELYDERDVAGRVIYVEASRGCPFKCEFCLSSLDVPLRQFPLEPFLAAMQSLLDRGVNRFKFVDRTFNLNLKVGKAILDFFLERQRPGLFVHFEMIPDRLPAALRETIAKFPPGALQFEVGIQTFNPEVCERISRVQDNEKAGENLRFLQERTGVHVHADLIVGLPGEGMESFAAGFDRLVALGPQEIQVGMLKRLRGTPIVRHDGAFAMRYSPHPPYEVLQTGAIDFTTMQRLRRFARYWDLVANSGNFGSTTPLLWAGSSGWPFGGFMAWSDWLHAKAGQTHGIALARLAELLFEYLSRADEAGLGGCGPDIAARALLADFKAAGRSDIPAFLRPWAPTGEERTKRPDRSQPLPPRQSRHAGQRGPRD
ncbi:MAG: DUF4080 domain-containing protein [Planctomycetota bacterium]|nr:DUF4080 domain-containing protein [Planctomycetota bacterium]